MAGIRRFLKCLLNKYKEETERRFLFIFSGCFIF